MEGKNIIQSTLNDSPNNTSSVRFLMPLSLKWRPKDDITTYELALCLPYIYRFQVMPYEIDASLNHFRHFEIINPNINENGR